MTFTSIWRLVSIYAGGTLAAQIISVASLPFLARLYPPAAFGEYAAVLGVVSIVTMASTLRLELALHVARSRRTANDLRRAALTSVAIASALVALGAAITLLLWRGDAGWSRYLHWLILLPALCLLVGVFNVQSAWLGRAGHHGAAARAQVMRVLVTAAAQLAAALLMGRDDATSLLVAALVGVSLAALTGRLESPAVVHPSWRSRRSWLRLRAAVRLFRDFPLLSAPQALVAALSNNSPALILATFADAAWAGQFAMADRIVRTPMVLVATSLRQGLTQGLAAVARSQSSALDQSRALCRQIALVLLLPTIAAFATAPWVIEQIMGPRWHDAGNIARWLMPWFYLSAIAVPITAAWQVTRQLAPMLSKDLALLILKVSVMIGAALFISPIAAVLIAVLAPSLGAAVTIWLGIRGGVGSKGARQARYM